MGGNGARLKKEPWMANERTLAEHRRYVEILRDNKKYPNNNTYKLPELTFDNNYSEGYQVTFWQIGDNYTPEEYARICNVFLKYAVDHITHAGKFEDTPEISFRFLDKSMAMRLARRFNQISIWDWKEGDNIYTGGTGRRK